MVFICLQVVKNVNMLIGVIMDSRKLAQNLRIDILNMIEGTGASHVGPNLSISDILAVLYSKVMNINIKNPTDPNRDQFILSKGHAGASVYAILAEMGFFSKEKLKEYYKNGSSLSGHVSHTGNPGVDFSTGSLGLGITVAVGKALAAKMNKRKTRIFTLVGNGECNEGSVWEAAMFAAHNKLDNFIVIVDDNKMQAMGDSKEILDMSNMADKWAAFGFKTIVVDGHNHEELEKALKTYEKNKPLAVICNTIKGKGVSFIENNIAWHYNKLSAEDRDRAIAEIGGNK